VIRGSETPDSLAPIGAEAPDRSPDPREGGRLERILAMASVVLLLTLTVLAGMAVVLLYDIRESQQRADCRARAISGSFGQGLDATARAAKVCD
jgi:hypothetical protein